MSTGRGNAARHVQDRTPGPWTKWKKMSRPARCIKFVETYLRPPVEGHNLPLKLADFQKDWIEEVLADGIEAAVRPVPRGNGKSTETGAVAAWALFDDTSTGAPSVPVVAVTIAQAIRGVYGTAASMIRNEPELANRSIEFTGVTTPRIYVPRTEGSMFPVSKDISGLQGLNPNFAVLDEVAEVEDGVWNTLKLSAGKRSRSLIWATGTPSLAKTNALWTIRERVMAGKTPAAMVYKEYAADPGCSIRDRQQWKKANPALVAGYLRESALVSDLDAVSEAWFRCYRLGLWVDGASGWLGEDGRAIWRRLEDPYELVPGSPAWIGVDIGRKKDSTAVCIVMKRPDNRLHAKVRIWEPTPDMPVSQFEVMAHLRELCKLYMVGAVSYDPTYWDIHAEVLYDEGLPMVEIPQSPEQMTRACGYLRARIQDGGLSHDHDQAFEEQVINAVEEPTPKGFRLSKHRSEQRAVTQYGGHIDAAIALALAVDRADHQQKPKARAWVG